MTGWAIFLGSIFETEPTTFEAIRSPLIVFE
jgi:hypothetical protein